MSLNLPMFLAKTGYVQPNDSKFTAYTEMPSNPEHLQFFHRCMSDPRLYESFSMHIVDFTKKKPDWTDTLQTGPILAEADLTQGPFMVELGGHYGTDTTRLLQKHPDLPTGALVLQDLPEVIEVAKTHVDSKIQCMAHDFFTPQPVPNSKIYFIHGNLHDWPDSLVLEIFKNLKPAMKKGYSKLLLNEVVVPPERASLPQAVMDVQMMGLFGSRERTKEHWTALLTQGGFSIVALHPDRVGLESIIEAELA
jgi:fumagillin biosynthesis methyltransferase